MRKWLGAVVLLVGITSATLADITITLNDYDKTTKTITPIPGLTVRVTKGGKSKDYLSDFSGQIKLPDGTYDVLVNPIDAPGYDPAWDNLPLTEGVNSDVDYVVPHVSPAK